MDRIKRLSYEVLDEHKPKFGEDFADNKKILNEIAIIRSKTLKNKVSGYITRFIKKEIREAKAKQERSISSNYEKQSDSEEVLETVTEEISEITIPDQASSEVETQTTSADEISETTEEKTE